MALQFNTFLRSVFWSLQFVLNAVPLITEVCCWLLQHISICSFQVLMFCIHEKKYCFVKQTSSEPGNTLLWSGSGDTCWLSSQGQVSTDYKSLFEEFVSMAPGLSEHLGFLPRCSKSTPQVTTLFYQNKQLRNECDKKDDSFSDTLDFELQTFWWMNMQIVGANYITVI